MALFYWDEKNKAHIAEHRVRPEEAEEVASRPAHPYPQHLDEDKWLVRGVTAGGRFLQVIYVWRPVEQIDFDLIAPEDALILDAIDKIRYVIHSRDLTSTERRALKQRRR